MLFLLLPDGATAVIKSDFLRELKILKEVNKYPHPNVLQLIGACSTAGNSHKKHVLVHDQLYCADECRKVENRCPQLLIVAAQVLL